MIIFENCIIQAPDGVCLSRCGLKKLNWYLGQELATLVCENPLTIRLKFEPSGREGLDNPLLLDGKPNICVVCGNDENLTRHHIFPYCFVRYMPLKYKLNSVHDIFPLCRACHNHYEKLSYEKKKELGKKYNLNVDGLPPGLYGKIRKTKASASALANHGSKMPTERKEYLISIVLDYLGKNEITEEDLNMLDNYNIKDHPDYQRFSKSVIEKITDYDQFVRDWREHFVTTMRPQFMPVNWSIDREPIFWIPTRYKRHKAS